MDVFAQNRFALDKCLFCFNDLFFDKPWAVIAHNDQSCMAMRLYPFYGMKQPAAKVIALLYSRISFVNWQTRVKQGMTHFIDQRLMYFTETLVIQPKRFPVKVILSILREE